MSNKLNKLLFYKKQCPIRTIRLLANASRLWNLYKDLCIQLDSLEYFAHTIETLQLAKQYFLGHAYNAMILIMSLETTYLFM